MTLLATLPRSALQGDGAPRHLKSELRESWSGKPYCRVPKTFNAWILPALRVCESKRNPKPELRQLKLNPGPTVGDINPAVPIIGKMPSFPQSRYFTSLLQILSYQFGPIGKWLRNDILSRAKGEECRISIIDRSGLVAGLKGGRGEGGRTYFLK